MLTADLRHSLTIFTLTYTLVISLFAPFAASAQPARTIKSLRVLQEQAAAPSRKGELLVRFRAGISKHEKEAILATQGARKKKDLTGESGIEKLELRSGEDARNAAWQLLQNPQVEFAEPNFLIAKDDTTPNDPRFNEQWALRNTGQNGGQFGSDVNASGAWATTNGSKSTVIAVIDSGIDFTHPDLVNNQWLNPSPSTSGDLHGWDYVANSAEIKDEQGHGTSVAGIIAAEGNNSVGITGVMWRASLMSLRVLDNTGTGDVESAVEAIDYATAHGAQVINLSWGTAAESVALRDALERAGRRSVVVVCSAGNNGRDLTTGPYYPASFASRNLISVTASDNLDQLSTFSNWGRNVTVAAPGTNILTTQMGGGYWNVTGTSAAAPIVTGIVGLLRTFHPGANPQQIARAVADGARKTASLSAKVSSGGVASAEGALAKLRGSANQSTVSPGPRFGSGGTGPGGSFSTTPPPTSTGAPAGAPDLDQLRAAKPLLPKAKTPIQSNLMCADCDPYGGGGGASNFPSGDPNFSTARRRPANEIGQPGVDLGSRNFNWGTSLISLPGRAGLDLNLGLYYNSLVWTKDGSFMKFNADLGSPAPGFRLGLPTLQQRFLNSQTGIYAYIMVSPSGGRVELRQVGTSNIYESADSSYTQLDVSNPNAFLVRTTDGTQYTFIPVTINSEYRCSQIKDRNGNYISAAYNTTNGHITSITDTLNRTIYFDYDTNSNLTGIRQMWGGVAHYWATFTYGQVFVAPNFGGGLAINGPNNNNVTVLTRVDLHDNSYFVFNYSNAFAQVNRINYHASDGRLREYTHYNLNEASGQTDCPRFTERRQYAENWNNGNEAVTYFSVAGDGSWTQQTAPDGTIYKEFFATSGWQTGLTTLTEFWSGGVKKKWTTVSWTQDDTGVSYFKNPRVTETNTYDAEGNRKRTTTTFTTFTLPSGVSCSLPADIYEYAANATTVLRRTHTDYRYDAAYLNRRMIGLPSLRWVYDGSGTLFSKTWFDYDWPSSSAHIVATPQNPVQHDSSYDINFVAGRGNLVLVLRFDLTDPDNTAGKASEYKYGYDTNGSLAFTRDHLWHQTNISYQDSFSDGNNSRNTFAYPTTITDPGGFTTTQQHNYDFGAVTRTQGPPPAGQSQGQIQTLTYDSATRLERVTLTNNGAYIRYIYGPYYLQTFSTINNVTDEAYSCQVFDGTGRTYMESANHPGSTGGYIGRLTTFDVMGRAVQQSNPTEITGTWVPAGDDAAWVYTSQAYDWKGRPTVTTLPDGSTRENTYGGCGCAGGETTTARDERGRRKRYTSDVLGRLQQVDELNWDQSVYSTTTYTYNVRDQLTQINQAGQLRSFAYDGHGRIQTRTTPEQGATTYSYFPNDTVQTVTDARGATTTLSYNSRDLVTGITYGVTGAVAATPNVTFGYDSAGNRTSMTDGLGSMSYAYDQLSRMTSETRTFTGVGSYTLNYAYNLASELTSITNPWGAQVGYGYDQTGRPTSVSGAGYAGVSSYISSLSYRAFGGTKQMNYANGRTLSLQYDNRQRLTSWSIPSVLRLQYNYLWENSGRVDFYRNLDDETLDRWFAYDHVGRLVVSRSGNEARLAIGESVPLLYNGPYSHGYQYDQWGNMTYREGWGGDNPSYTATYTNNKRNGLTYDAAGYLTNDGGQNFTYDATGQQTQAYYSGYLLQQYYDGNGLRVKKAENSTPTYYLRSSVLGGQVVAEINGSGGLQRGYVYLGGQLVAVQQSNAVSWVHEDPVAKSKRITNSSGAVVSTIELDPWGANTNRSSNLYFQPRRLGNYEQDQNASDEAMFRRYNRWWSRFDQPDPYDGSYNLASPQSFNRYSYVQNDPVTFSDPTGLMWQLCGVEFGAGQCIGQGFWGGGFNVNDRKSSIPTFVSGGNSGREIIDISFNASRTFWAVYRGIQYTDANGDEHAYFWWEKIWSTVYLFGGNPLFNPTGGDPRVQIGGGSSGGSKPPKTPAPTPPAPTPPPTCEGGQGDINFQWNPMVVGYTGGLMTNGNNFHPYGGMMIGTPRAGASLMVNTKANIEPGLNYSIGGGFIIGAQWSGKFDPYHPVASLLNGSLMVGGTTPGFGASMVYVSRPFNLGAPCTQGADKPGIF